MRTTKPTAVYNNVIYRTPAQLLHSDQRCLTLTLIYTINIREIYEETKSKRKKFVIIRNEVVDCDKSVIFESTVDYIASFDCRIGKCTQLEKEEQLAMN